MITDEERDRRKTLFSHRPAGYFSDIQDFPSVIIPKKNLLEAFSWLKETFKDEWIVASQVGVYYSRIYFIDEEYKTLFTLRFSDIIYV